MDCFRDKYVHEDHEKKYKVFLVYDDDMESTERLAGMGHNLPYPRLSTLLLGGTWRSARTKKTYERIL